MNQVYIMPLYLRLFLQICVSHYSKSRNIKRRIIMVMDLGQTQKWDTKFDLKAKTCSTDEVRKYSYCSPF